MITPPFSIVLSGMLIMAYTTVNAQNNAADVSEEIATKFAAPANPALEFISANSSDISRPSNIKQLAAGLISGIDGNGKVKQGLAIEVAPFSYLQIKITPEDYRNNILKYMVYNTQVSMGTVAISGDSKSTDLGWGGRVTILDKSDPMANEEFISDFEDALDKLKPANPGDAPTAAQLTAYKDAIDALKDKWLKEHWNAEWITIAYAGGSRLGESKLSKRGSLGHQILIAGGIPVKEWGQMSFLAKWTNQQNNGLSHKLEEMKIGQRFLIGGKSFNFFEEISFNPLLNKKDFEGNNLVDTQKAFSWTVGIEFKVTDGVWVVTGLGENANRIVGAKGIQVTSGLRMGISDKSRLN